jgi:hypothetical protein
MIPSKKLVRPVAAGLILLGVLGAGACKKGLPLLGGKSAAGPQRGDALFLAAAPAVVPDELTVELDAMGIRRLYVAAASLSASGQVVPFPPPPSPIQRPVVLVLMGEPGAEAGLRGGSPELLGEAWATGIQKLAADAKSWAQVSGVHVHIFPAPADAPALGKALSTLRDRLKGLTVSVTVRAGAPAETWEPLAGSVDEALVLSFGRRPETADLFAKEMSEEEAKAFPVPFRLLLIPGSYGVAGTGESARRLADAEIDKLSEDRNLDFDFAAVLSSEPGSIYNFKPRTGYEKEANLLSDDGGRARFDILPFADLVRLVNATSRWSAPRLAGRVFLVDGVPRDGHLSGYPALHALLTGKPWEPSLKVESVEGKGGGGEVWLRVSNPGTTPSELSRFGNTALGAGDFDRYEIFASARDMTEPAPFGRATACRLFENFFAPEEVNEVGPIRVAGAQTSAFISYQLTLPDGRTLTGPETQIAISAAPPPTPTPQAKAKPKGQPPMPKLKRR